jgi:hypothetical protein
MIVLNFKTNKNNNYFAEIAEFKSSSVWYRKPDLSLDSIK